MPSFPQVVTMCLELYLVAYRVGMQTHYERGEALWQSLIITQTFVVFLLVSIQASAVYEEVGMRTSRGRMG